MELYERTEILRGFAEKLDGAKVSAEKIADALDAGEPNATFELHDTIVNLQFDLDEMDECFGLGGVEAKRNAILAVAGVASVLAAHQGAGASLAASQAVQMASALTAAAKDLDNYANRATLYGGVA